MEVPTPPEAASNTASSATIIADWWPELLKMLSPVFTARIPWVLISLRKKSFSDPTKTAFDALTTSFPRAYILTSSRWAISMAVNGIGESIGLSTTWEIVALRPDSETKVPFCLIRSVLGVTDSISQNALSAVAFLDLLITRKYRPA